MWNTFGSLRDRVRENATRVAENAKAAAVVAQGVLQAAAAEEDDDPVSTNTIAPTSQPEKWDQWNYDQAPQNEVQQESHVLPPPPPPPPPLPVEGELLPPPPPPPRDCENLLPVPLPPGVKGRGGRRSKRYVVAELVEKKGGEAGGVEFVKPGGMGAEEGGESSWGVVKEQNEKEEDEKDNKDGIALGGWEGMGEWDVVGPVEVEHDGMGAGNNAPTHGPGNGLDVAKEMNGRGEEEEKREGIEKDLRDAVDAVEANEERWNVAEEQKTDVTGDLFWTETGYNKDQAVLEGEWNMPVAGEQSGEVHDAKWKVAGVGSEAQKEEIAMSGEGSAQVANPWAGVDAGDNLVAASEHMPEAEVGDFWGPAVCVELSAQVTESSPVEGDGGSCVGLAEDSLKVEIGDGWGALPDAQGDNSFEDVAWEVPESDQKDSVAEGARQQVEDSIESAAWGVTPQDGQKASGFEVIRQQTSTDTRPVGGVLDNVTKQKTEATSVTGEWSVPAENSLIDSNGDNSAVDTDNAANAEIGDGWNDEGWEVSSDQKEPAVESGSVTFAWDESQSGGGVNCDAAVNWFSGGAGQPTGIEPEKAKESTGEDFFGNLVQTTAALQGSAEVHKTTPALIQHTTPAEAKQTIPGSPNADSIAAGKDKGQLVPAQTESGLDGGTALGSSATSAGSRDVEASVASMKLEQQGMQSFKYEAPANQTDAFWMGPRDVNSIITDHNKAVIPPPPTQELVYSLPQAQIGAPMPSFASQHDAGGDTSALLEEINQLKNDLDASHVDREARVEEICDLHQMVAKLQDVIVNRDQDFNAVCQERDNIRNQRDELAEEKLQVESERDAAIDQGGGGIREARNVIEVMRNAQDVAGKREVVISRQIETLRVDFDQIAEERNSLLTEAEELKLRLKEVEGLGKMQEDDLKQQMKLMENKVELAQLEREKALTASQLHVQEHKQLLEAEQAMASTLAASQSRVRDLESSVHSMHRDREDELARIESFSGQMEEMKERTKTMIEERNALYEEKLKLQKNIEDFGTRDEQIQRSLSDARREHSSAVSERDEARNRYATLREQFKETTKQLNAVSAERDRLMQERTSAATSSCSVSEKEKSLAAECQQKTSAIVVLQRNITSAAAKIEKLNGQKATYHRQRDEAGARLRAAGAEFATLTGKLENAVMARDNLQDELIALRDERDKAISQIHELSETVAEKKLVDENLEDCTKQLKDTREELAKAREENNNLSDARSAFQQKSIHLVTEANAAQGKYEVARREKDMLQSQLDAVEEEKQFLQKSVADYENAIAEAVKIQKSAEAELTTTKEKTSLDIGIMKAELTAEQNIRTEQSDKLVNLQNTVEQYAGVLSKLRDSVSSSLQSVERELKRTGGINTTYLDCLNEADENVSDNLGQSASAVISKSCRVLVTLSKEISNANKDVISLRQERDELTKTLESLEHDRAAVKSVEVELVSVRNSYVTVQQKLQALDGEKKALGGEKKSLEMHCQVLEENLRKTENRAAELDHELNVATVEMKHELEHNTQMASEERARLSEEVDDARTKMMSIWNMLQKSLASQQVDFYGDSLDAYGESPKAENVPVLALRATASLVAELERNRLAGEEAAQRLSSAEADIALLKDRSEIAEQERDAFRATNERLEKKAKVAFAEGDEASRSKFESIITQTEDDLDDTRNELNRVKENCIRSEKEAGDLRALCSKLTSQFNGRTNELDEAEERVVYLQDQVSNLEEDLQEAHRRLKEHEEETAEARRSDVDRLTGELDEAIGHVERLEKECAKLREACDSAENTARESELLAETHRKAEANLQIAIEQLEAAQESSIEQKTIELQKRVHEAEEVSKRAMKREEEMAATENKMQIRDDEIRELRGAIGRLADERVELKLELEKSLSRLNHPDAGGQLVDRRVVRQLLISYFRVGSIRRRDVLELMSRMLAFSESDNIAVGLKRRALMDRIGSLVQPPELDDAQLPPLGTVSDKWIEFLMNETEEGEEQSKGW